MILQLILHSFIQQLLIKCHYTPCALLSTGEQVVNKKKLCSYFYGTHIQSSHSLEFQIGILEYDF